LMMMMSMFEFKHVAAFGRRILFKQCRQIFAHNVNYRYTLPIVVMFFDV